MTRPYFIYNAIRYLIDAPLLFVSFLIAQHFFPNSHTVISLPYAYTYIIFSIIAWYSCAQFSRLYTDLRSKKFAEEIMRIIFTILLFAILFTSLLFFLRKEFNFSNQFLAAYFLSLFFTVALFKYIIRKYLHSVLYRGKLLNHVILIGSTPAAKDFYDTINYYYYYGYKCIGFVDDHQSVMNGCPYLGKIADLPNLLTTTHVDEVIVALPNSQHDNIKSTIDICDYYAKRIRLIPDLDLYASSNIQINTIGLLPVINLRALPLDKQENKLLKRLFDIFFAIGFFLTIGWWVMPLIAMMIRLTSKGPVFFKQERWGLNNEMITCYKFRTMYTGSPETDGNGEFLQASENDIRVTRLGRFLRKHNIDEYPQFWNVLIGNMSVVGPRPHVTPLNNASIASVDQYMLRHLVKPGITGWAQVNGSRGETSTPGAMQRRINFDLYYIHKWTFWLDCQIILQTIINIIKGDKNAY